MTNPTKAPVLITVYNRYEHFKNCINSLQKNDLATDTDLYIAIDAPYRNEDIDLNNKIIEFSRSVDGFKSVNLIVRPENFGSKRNLREAISAVLSEHGRIILSEDDNVFSNTFLEYMNIGLDLYENRSDVFAITGYNQNFKFPDWYKENTYLRIGFAGWGCGLWKKKWDEVEWTMDNFNSMFRNKRNMAEIKRSYIRILPQLLKIKRSKVIDGDVFLFLYLLNSNKYMVYPKISRVRNDGNDGSGLHKGISIKLSEQTIYDGPETDTFNPDITYDTRLMKSINRQLNGDWLDNLYFRSAGFESLPGKKLRFLLTIIRKYKARFFG